LKEPLPPTELVEDIAEVTITTYRAVFYKVDFLKETLLPDYLLNPVQEITGK
jgi:hypothetical protein